MYQVYQDGKPCSEYKVRGWDKDTFYTLEEAKHFCAHWAFPIGEKQIPEFLVRTPSRPNTPVDMSYTTVPVMMEIRQI